MVWNRDEYIAHMTFEYTGKEMLVEIFGLLVGLEEEWRSQGASDEEISLEAFNFDSVMRAGGGGTTSAITKIQPRILEETKENIISIDRMGRTQKLIKSSATIPLPIDHPVKTFDDWLKIKHWYSFSEERVNKDRLQQLKNLWDMGYMVQESIPGGFDEPRQLMGEEATCIAYYEEPELIRDILETISDTALRVFERIFEVVPIDALFVHEDMAGKSGPLAGPAQIREFIAPYYRKVWDECQRHGAKLFLQDSDGNMDNVIDSFLDAGINVMYPFEPQSGMDMVKTRQKYGSRLAIQGGIDKFALRGTKEDIRKELEYKICPITKGGGTIFGLDHRIPNGVPLENYRYYVNLAREMLGL